MRVQVTTRLRRRRNFSYESLNARKDEKSRADELPTRFAVEFFLSYESLKSRKRRIFLPKSYIQGQVLESQGSPRVRQGWTVATRRGREEEKKRKRPRKARRWLHQRQGSVCSTPRIPFFWFTSIWVWKRPVSVEVSAPAFFFTRKPCAKEVPEIDYTLEGLLYAPIQRKRYLKRTTLRRLKIPLRSIRSEEGPHYRLSEV